MIKATIRERYISSENGIAHEQVKEIIHDARLFSSEKKFNQWLQTFQHELWQDDPTKVKLVEGIYVDKQEVAVDDTTPPQQIREYATFRKGVSYYYAREDQQELMTA